MKDSMEHIDFLGNIKIYNIIQQKSTKCFFSRKVKEMEKLYKEWTILDLLDKKNKICPVSWQGIFQCKKVLCTTKIPKNEKCFSCLWSRSILKNLLAEIFFIPDCVLNHVVNVRQIENYKSIYKFNKFKNIFPLKIVKALKNTSINCVSNIFPYREWKGIL